ncbi:hypothetical protein GOP47_0004521 [Adiantum capillus-veneris]|uniref:Uncharacterized protein n=1 Tax=Adiantum capillus-veneris TaxID=13818 RepID=A0A9D4ZMP3_ADICA|nr:hypothetical protein GOP47_0004521 [Adiantum capillus-veneris]
MTDHAAVQVQKRCQLYEDEQEKQHLEQTSSKNQDRMSNGASPAAEQQHAIVIHKPQPFPLRPSILSPSPFSSFSCSLKLLFDREHEVLLQWQKTDFQAFSEEVQESLGGTLKKHLREYQKALGLLILKPLMSKDGNLQASRVVASSAVASSPKDLHENDGEKDGREAYLRARQKHFWHCSPRKEGILQLVDAARDSSRPQFDGTDSALRDRTQERRYVRRNIHIGGAIMQGFGFHDNHLLQETQEDRIEKVIETFVKAREAVVSVREVSQRIEEHRTWMQMELNLTRLELMNLRFCRCDSPRAVLCEALELGAVVRSFILELSSALDCNELGVPWPLSRKADCSDVTPLFIKHLVTTLPPANSAS